MTRRRRFWLAGVSGALALAIASQAFHVAAHLEPGAHVEGSEAEQVDQQLAQGFHSSFVHRVVFVIQGLPSPDTEDGKQALVQITRTLRSESGVSGTLSHLDRADPMFLGRNGGTFVIVGLTGINGVADAVIPKLRERARILRDQLRGRYPALKFELTGDGPINFDMRRINSDDVHRAEGRGIPALLLLLLATFAGIVAALLPLGVGLLATLMTLGSAAFLGRWWHLSILIENIATMLGLGLGIDYALLMVCRFREGLAGGHNAAQAADTAARHAGRTVLISGATVAIGFAALVTVPISDLRSIGVAGTLVAGACILLANLVLPAILTMLGPRIHTGRLPLLNWANPDSARARAHWRNWSHRVTAKPWMALVLSVSPLLLLASQATQLHPGLPRIDWLPQGAESVRALHSLDNMGRSGVVQSLRVILELPAGSEVTTYAGWNALRLLTARLAGDKRADRVISLTSLLGAGLGPSFLPLLSAETRQSFLQSNGRAALLELMPAAEISTSELGRWVRELRASNVGELTEVGGATIRVGGLAALDEDYGAVIRDRLPRVLVLVLGGTLFALIIGFRCIAVAVKAIVLNLLSVTAALGALVLVVQNGHGGALLGVPAGTGAVFSSIPILAFAIIFGLSMDYEVFLVARVLEARRTGWSETDAIAEGVAKTGGLITNAAAIMLIVFAAFTLGDVIAVKMLGFTLAVAVLIDATLVRMVIGPALLRLAGDWNWWPWGLARNNPRRVPGAGMLVVRSLVFNIFLYAFTALCSVAAMCLAIIWPSRLTMVARLWSRGWLYAYRCICGVTFRVHGAEHVPEGTCIIAMKHQSIWESLASFAIFRQPVFVLKRELLWIPIFGWVLNRMGFISVQRGAGKLALESMIRGARKACAQGSQIVIFPEGTRSIPGSQPAYKSGVSHLYKALQVSCVPVALNSGILWPRRRFLRPPGVITVQILPAISPGLPRRQMFERLVHDIEAGCEHLDAG